MTTLVQITTALNAALGNPAMFSLVNTRVILRTGVDLRNIAPEQNANGDCVTKVLTALEAMGYSRSSFELIAKKGT